MSVHPCIRCGEQAPACTCPDGPHHEPGKGDVTAEIAERVVELTPEVLMQRLADANREIDRLRRRVIEMHSDAWTCATGEMIAVKATLADRDAECAIARRERDEAREKLHAAMHQIDRITSGWTSRAHTVAEIREWIGTRVDAVRADVRVHRSTMGYSDGSDDQFDPWLDRLEELGRAESALLRTLAHLNAFEAEMEAR